MQKLAQICIRRPVFATMLILALVVLGFDAYRKLGVDLFPKIEFPTVTITTTLRGAAPEEVESEVTKRIEEAVNTISGIDDLRSISSEGISQVIITFLLEKDPDVAAQEVRDKVAAIQRDLPRDVDPPVIEKISTDASPVINVVVASKRDLRETTKLVDDQIKKNIESLNGVGQVRFVGDRKRQIQVWLDPTKLQSYRLNIDQIRAALAAQNVEIPGGRVDQGARELTLRTLGRITQPADFNKIVVATVQGSPVRVSDIGYAEDGVEEPRSLALLNGTPSVVLEVRKQSGTNTLDVIHTVKARIEELNSTLPPDFRITYARDQSTFIERSFKAVQEHLILGGIFASIIVLFFIRSWRSTLIAAVAIPTSIISTYTLMNAMGFTLNQITMLALTLVVGIVIDDAIVVLENIFRFAEEKNLTPMQAAIEGTRDIGLAVLATTLSLVIIFLPVALMGGIVGRFMSSFGYTAAFAIMVSLLVSFTLTPMLCSRFLRPSDTMHGSGTKDTFLYRSVARPYRKLLRWSMDHRWVIVMVGFVVMLSTVPLFMLVGKDFLPQDDQSEFEITVRMPVGSSLEGTRAVMEQIENEVRQLPGLKFLLTTIGADVRKQVDRGSIFVELVDVEQRKQSQAQLMLMARQRLKKFRDVTIGVQLPSIIQGAGPNQDLQFFIQGPDLNRLDQYAAAIKKRLAQMRGVADLDTSYEPGKPELRVNINRDKAADLNVNVASIATALRTLVGGDDQVTTYREGDDRYDVQLRVQKEYRTSPAALQMLYVPSASLGNVPVANVASLTEAAGPTQIERYNRQRQILLSANLIEGQALSNVIPVLNQTVSNLNMPPGYASGLVGRSKEFGRASANYVIAFLLSIVFMYMVLAAQFESFVDPVTILISLPLSVPFALVSLLLARENFSIIYTSLGILILFGIVKKNSILQIDHIKSLRFNDGLPRLEAILRGCEDRLRPILMTTAALVAGMIPLALGTGAGAGSRRTVAIVVIGGQTLCLLLTLLVTPVAYSLFDDMTHSPVWSRFAERFARLFQRGGIGLRRAWDGISSLFALLLIALVLGSPPARAQASARPQTPAEPAPAGAMHMQPGAGQRVGVGVITRRMTLQEAIELALANNLDIEIEKTNTATSLQAVKGAQGAFDPTLRYLPSLQSLATPTGSSLQAPDGKLADRNFANDLHLLWRVPKGGTQFNVDFLNGRLSTSNPFVSITPFVTSRLTLSLAQPLLRNRTIDSSRLELNVRRKDVDISDTQFELRVIDVVTRVQQVYWNLVAARETVDVASDSVNLAREQLARTQRLIEANQQAPVELSAAEAELQRRLDNYYTAVGTVTEAENTLKNLISRNRADTIWSDEIIPTQVRDLEPPVEDDVRAAVDQAIKRRPEMRLQQLVLDTNDLQKRFNADQVKPGIDLVAAYWNSGLAGDYVARGNPFADALTATFDRVNELSALAGLAPVPPPSFGGSSAPPGLTGGYGQALSNLFNGRFPSFQVGFQFDLNIRNRTAQAGLAQARIAEKRLTLQRAQIEQGIEAQVRNALQALYTAKQRIAAADASVRAAREKLDSETRLYQGGESTNFLVLTRQNEYAESRLRAVLARLALSRSLADLEQAQGTTLPTNNVNLK